MIVRGIAPPYYGGRRLITLGLSGAGLDGGAVGARGGMDNRGDSFDGDELNGGAIVDPFMLASGGGGA